MPDRLAEIRLRRAAGFLIGEDYDWLLAEVDRLRAEVVEAEREGFGNGVEWAGS